MKHHSIWSKACACVAITALIQPSFGMAQQQETVSPIGQSAGSIEAQHRNQQAAAASSTRLTPLSTAKIAVVGGSNGNPLYTDPVKQALLQAKIKYVFVLFQENRSFDYYFGTYPGANGLFTASAANTPGFVQPIVETDGTVGTISPFKMPQSVVNTSGVTTLLYPEDADSVNHGHTAIDAKLHLNTAHIPQNDRYAFTEQGLSGTLSADGKTYTGPTPTLAQKQKGELVMSHVDCDTAPFLWNYADRFTLMDEFFDTVIGPSTPNAIAMIAGQSGETQWVRHPELASNNTTTSAQLPVTADPQPFWGSALDYLTPPSQQQPVDNPGGVSTNPSSNLTFATLPLSFMGDKIENKTANDLNPAFDLLDVQEDIKKIAGEGVKPTNWGWYQEGYDVEPTDTNGTATHDTYIAHHNAPQYFGYIANNPEETKNHMKGLADFYADVKAEALPAEGGVFYVRGGYGNNDKLIPRSPSPAVKANFQGSDDHPAYSDGQISEALIADSINAIASSKYWKDSAIIITYDETDGLYDHTQPWIRSYDPLGNALDQGPRIPAIVISPYAKVHTVDHERSEHGSIIKFIDALYNLTALGDLPDEYGARIKGSEVYGQNYLGPSDAHTVGVGNLFSAFDDARLNGTVAPLPASYATIPAAQVTTLPHFGAVGCRALQITPTDTVNGKLLDPAPADFNPRPSTNPGLPTSSTWPTN